MKLPAAIYEGKTDMGGLMKNWFWSYLGNFVGSLAFVWAVVASGVLAPCTGYAIKTAMAKATLPWGQVRDARAGGGGCLGQLRRGREMSGRRSVCAPHIWAHGTVHGDVRALLFGAAAGDTLGTWAES
jgi:hypothetical protein